MRYLLLGISSFVTRLYVKGLILNFPRDVDVFLVEWPYVAMQVRRSIQYILQSPDLSAAVTLLSMW